jgi:hypothetical protein
MSEPLDSYLLTIRTYAPELSIASAQLNTDGMTNAVVIINGGLAFRFPKTEAAHALQQYEAELLAVTRPRLLLPVPRSKPRPSASPCTASFLVSHSTT